MAQEVKDNNQYPFIPTLLICGVNTPVCVQLLVNKPEFMLGKSDECDGVLSFNEEISREHCLILYKDGEYYIRDDKSTNGTYLNGALLEKGVAYPLVEGDRLRLSASSFTVEKLHNVPVRKN